MGADAMVAEGIPMPVHDWTLVDAGIFHHFHQRWISALTDILNERLLPDEYYALAEQQSGRFETDVLIVDMQPPTRRDPDGIHGAIWDEVAGEPYTRPSDKPLTLAAYEAGTTVRAFIEPVRVGDALCDMPLFLDPGRFVAVPLEETYEAAFAPCRSVGGLCSERNGGRRRRGLIRFQFRAATPAATAAIRSAGDGLVEIR